MQPTNGKEKEEWKDLIDSARALFQQGRKEIVKAIELAKDKGQDAFDSARDKSQEVWEDAKVSGVHALKDVKARGEEAWEDTEKLIRKHPSRAIGLSLLVGVIVGALLTRRDRD